MLSMGWIIKSSMSLEKIIDDNKINIEIIIVLIIESKEFN